MLYTLYNTRADINGNNDLFLYYSNTSGVITVTFSVLHKKTLIMIVNFFLYYSKTSGIINFFSVLRKGIEGYHCYFLRDTLVHSVYYTET